MLLKLAAEGCFSAIAASFNPVIKDEPDALWMNAEYLGYAGHGHFTLNQCQGKCLE